METEGEKNIFFTKMQFITYFNYEVEYAIILDIPQQELAIIKYSTATGEVIDSKGIELGDHEMEEILPMCNALEFEKYRNMEPDMCAPGF